MSGKGRQRSGFVLMFGPVLKAVRDSADRHASRSTTALRTRSAKPDVRAEDVDRRAPLRTGWPGLLLPRPRGCSTPQWRLVAGRVASTRTSSDPGARDVPTVRAEMTEEEKSEQWSSGRRGEAVAPDDSQPETTLASHSARVIEPTGAPPSGFERFPAPTPRGLAERRCPGPSRG
jgi:hypothetical protein